MWKTHHDYAKFSSARRDRNDFWEAIKGTFDLRSFLFVWNRMDDNWFVGLNRDSSSQCCGNVCGVRARVAFLNWADRTTPERERGRTDVALGCWRSRWSCGRAILRLRPSQRRFQRLHQSLCESSQTETQLPARVCLVMNSFTCLFNIFF